MYRGLTPLRIRIPRVQPVADKYFPSRVNGWHMEVADVMSAPVVTVDPEAPLDVAVASMLEDAIGSVVVVDLAPVGILTRTDILRAIYDESAPLDTLEVADAMTADPVTVQPSASLDVAIKTMEEHHIKRLPVIDGLDLVGMITTTDIARHLPERVQEVRATIGQKDRWTD